MKSSCRGLLLTASVPLVLLLAAPALAATTLSEYKCENPESAANDLYDYFEDHPLDTSGLDPDDCEKLCSELQKLCESNVKNRIACIKTDDSFAFRLGTKFCDVYYTGDTAKACKEDVKSDKSFHKEENASLDENGRAICDDYFGIDGYCQFDCEDGLLDDD